MKIHHLFVAIYLLFVAFVHAGCYTSVGRGGSGDTATQEPDRRATGFIIHTSDDAEMAYRRIAGMLADREFSLAETDAVLYSIVTDWRSLKGGNMVIRVRAMVRDDDGVSISIRGDMLSNVNVGQALLGSWMREDAPTPIDERGMKGSPARLGWEELESIAYGYPGGSVELTY